NLLPVIGISLCPLLRFGQQASARYFLREVLDTFLTTHRKINTALQLALMGITTVHPLLPFELGLSLTGLQFVASFFPEPLS
ncbi:hypothetical protein C0992_008326, partial [Termitomyces sp. T32_za158]